MNDEKYEYYRTPQARSVARAATLHETIQSQLAMDFADITVKHAGGTVTLTPEQARAVVNQVMLEND